MIFLYKVVEDLVPAINPNDCLVKSKHKGEIKPKTFDSFKSDNIAKNSVMNNTKAIDTITYSTDRYTNSFFVTSMTHMNQLEDSC